MPRDKRATELCCNAGLEGERLRDKGHAGQEARARTEADDFIVREVGSHRGFWSRELVV